MHGRWWEEEPRLRRFLEDLVAAEVAAGRRSAAALPARPWPATARLDADLGIDSLERLAAATALAEAIHLHESGIEDALLARRTVGEWAAIAAAALGHFDARLTFRTSGSTGTPKRCTHTLEALLREVDALAALVGPRRRVLTAVPAHHIYGFLFTVLLPWRLGIPEGGVLDVRTSSPAAIGSVARAGDLVVAHPAWWGHAAGFVDGIAADVIGVTSTAPCPDEVARCIEAAGVELLQVYGSTETAGIGWRRTHRAPYALFDHVAAGVAAPDALAWEGPRHFRVAARKDDAVQVGGVNVFPSRVREVLLGHPAVADAAVRLMRPEEGGRLKAFIVADDAARHDARFEAELRAWMSGRLAAPERPAALRFGASLPRNEGGKLADWSIDAP